MIINAKIFKTLLGMFTLIVFVSTLLIVIKFAGDVPTFKEGPAPRLGDELGWIRPESAEKLRQLFQESGLPSMAAGVVVGDELVWARGFGEQPDLSTVYMIGSIDKTFITTAVLQLREQGLIDLDDDINDYLPYPVRHPDYPDVPITILMLLTHTSGLPHDVPGTNFVHGKDGPMVRWELFNQSDFDSLLDYLFPPSEEKLGTVFEIGAGEGPGFWLYKPGNGYQYSNTAFYPLLASIIEEVSGQSLNAYLMEHVIAPLGMENTSFEASDYPQAQLAIPYEDFSTNGMSDLPLTGMTASGKIRTNVLDLANYLLAHMNEGALGDRRILEPESAALMHERQRRLSINDFPPKFTNGIALCWFQHSGGYQGHSGFLPGFMAEILYNDHEAVPYGMVIMMTKSHSKTEIDRDWWRQYYVPFMETLLEEGKAMAQAKGN